MTPSSTSPSIRRGCVLRRGLCLSLLATGLASAGPSNPGNGQVRPARPTDPVILKGIEVDAAFKMFEEFGSVSLSSPYLIPAPGKDAPNPFAFVLKKQGDVDVNSDWFLARAREDTNGAVGTSDALQFSLGAAGALQQSLPQRQAAEVARQNFSDDVASHQRRKQLALEEIDAQYKVDVAVIPTSATAEERAKKEAEADLKRATARKNLEVAARPDFPAAEALNTSAPAVPAAKKDAFTGATFDNNGALLVKPAGAPTTNVPLRSALIAAAGHQSTYGLLSVLGDPAKYVAFEDKKVLLGVAMVNVDPGWRTQNDFVGEVAVTVGYDYQPARPEVLLAAMRKDTRTNPRAKLVQDLITAWDSSYTDAAIPPADDLREAISKAVQEFNERQAKFDGLLTAADKLYQAVTGPGPNPEVKVNGEEKKASEHLDAVRSALAKIVEDRKPLHTAIADLMNRSIIGLKHEGYLSLQKALSGLADKSKIIDYQVKVQADRTEAVAAAVKAQAKEDADAAGKDQAIAAKARVEDAAAKSTAAVEVERNQTAVAEAESRLTRLTRDLTEAEKALPKPGLLSWGKSTPPTNATIDNLRQRQQSENEQIKKLVDAATLARIRSTALESKMGKLLTEEETARITKVQASHLEVRASNLQQLAADIRTANFAFTAPLAALPALTTNGLIGQAFIPDALVAAPDRSPLVAAVSPMTDLETLDLTTSTRRQFEVALQLSAVFQGIGQQEQAQLFSSFARRLQRDAQTRSSLPTLTAFSHSGGIFGFRTGPRLRANKAPDELTGKPGSQLERQAFPVMIMIGMDADDIGIRFRWRGDRPEPVEPVLRFTQTTRWSPIKHGFWWWNQPHFSQEKFATALTTVAKARDELKGLDQERYARMAVEASGLAAYFGSAKSAEVLAQKVDLRFAVARACALIDDLDLAPSPESAPTPAVDAQPPPPARSPAGLPAAPSTEDGTGNPAPSPRTEARIADAKAREAAARAREAEALARMAEAQAQVAAARERDAQAKAAFDETRRIRLDRKILDTATAALTGIAGEQLTADQRANIKACLDQVVLCSRNRATIARENATAAAVLRGRIESLSHLAYGASNSQSLPLDFFNPPPPKAEPPAAPKPLVQDIFPGQVAVTETPGAFQIMLHGRGLADVKKILTTKAVGVDEGARGECSDPVISEKGALVSFTYRPRSEGTPAYTAVAFALKDSDNKTIALSPPLDVSFPKPPSPALKISRTFIQEPVPPPAGAAPAQPGAAPATSATKTEEHIVFDGKALTPEQFKAYIEREKPAPAPVRPKPDHKEKKD